MAPRWRRVDWVWLLLMACLAIPVVIHRERMGDSASGIAAMRYLQSLSSVLLAVPVIVALGLHRMQPVDGRRALGGGAALDGGVSAGASRELVLRHRTRDNGRVDPVVECRGAVAIYDGGDGALERDAGRCPHAAANFLNANNRHKIASLMHAEIGSLVAGSLAECGVRTGAGFCTVR
jgi:hypothetical protein